MKLSLYLPELRPPSSVDAETQRLIERYSDLVASALAIQHGAAADEKYVAWFATECEALAKELRAARDRALEDAARVGHSRRLH